MRRLVVALVALAALAAPSAAAAHPLGNFTINRYSLIAPGPGRVDVTFVVDVAEIPTFQALGGSPSTAVAAAWARRQAPGWAARLRLRLDGRAVRLRVLPGGVTASVHRGQGGLSITRATVRLRARVAGSGPFEATYDDGSFGDHLGWKEIVLRPAPRVVLTASTASTHDVSHMLRHYPSGMLQTPLDVTHASFAYRYGSGGGVDVAAPSGGGGASASTWGSGFTDLVSHGSLSAGFVAIALLVAMFWGALHALTPGHGKSIVAAYLVGSRGTARHAVFLGATVTVTHTAGVFALGAVTLYLSRYILPETLYPWLSLLSGLFVVAMAASIAWGRLRAWRHTRAHALGHAHHHHRHGHHHHDHGPGGHSHLPPGADGSPVTARSLLALGISGGLLPCPSALVVMLGSIALHRVAFGLVLVLAFSLGLAGTLTAIGLLVVYARRLLERVPASARAAGLIAVASAVVIAGLGVALTLQALAGYPGAFPAPLEHAASAAIAGAHRVALPTAAAALAALGVHAARRTGRAVARRRDAPGEAERAAG